MSGTIQKFIMEGGPVMFVLIPAMLVCLLVPVLQIFLHKRVNLIPLMVATIVGTLVVGTAGTAQGLWVLFDAVKYAPDDIFEQALALGLHISLNPLIFAVGIALAATPFAGVAATVHINAKRS